jgi:RNA polymerase sigma factor (sigma-70 family)
MMDRPDAWASLLRAANTGDSVAYDAFLRAVAPVVRGIVRAKAGGLDAHACEDIVQEVLLAIHLKRQTWAADLPVRPWVYAITRYKVIDALRRHRGNVSPTIDEVADHIAAPAEPDPFLARDAERMLSRLDPKSQGILRAVAFEGAKLADIGRSLAISEGAARVALHRALQRLASLRKREE